jgi:uncharacterized repeat protein (TIGR01451 family)
MSRSLVEDRATLRRLLVIPAFFLFFAYGAAAQSADLVVTKDGPAIASAGSNVTYTITVSNLGPDDATTLQLDDNLPAGMTFVSLVAPGTWACTDPGAGNTGLVQCTNPTLTAGSTDTFTLVTNIAALTPSGTFFTNVATITSDFDPDSENDAGTAVTSTPPPPTSDMAITKSGPSSGAPGADVSYSITVTNIGPDAAANVQWTDTLPGNMTFVSLQQNSGPAFSCTSGNTTTCDLASMAAGATASFTLTGNVPAATPSGTSYSNTVTVTTDNLDPTPINDSAITTLVISAVNLSVVKSGPATGVAGANLTYTITAANAGPDNDFQVSLNDNLPAGETFVSLNQNTGPAAICSSPSVGLSGPVSCLFNNLGAGSSAQFTLVVATAPTSTQITNTATISSQEFDSDTSNNTSSATTTFPIDVAVMKTAPATAAAGTPIAYAIAVTNNGPSAAQTVALTDSLPGGTTFVSLSQTAGPAFTCTAPAAGGSGTVTCNIATLASGATANFTLTVRTPSSASAGIVSNTATVTTSSIDSNAPNDTSTASTTINTSADLGVTKTGPANVARGATATYTITVANSGPSDAQTVVLNDLVPANATFASFAQTSGPAFGCTTPAAGGTGTVSCTIATLTNGSSATFTLVIGINIAAPSGSTIINTAAVSAATADPSAVNNSASSGAVVTAPDLSVLKTAAGSAPAGGNISYTITVSNIGTGDATTVSLTDVLPASVTFTSISQNAGPAFSCTGPTPGTTGTVTCSAPTLTAGSTATFTLLAGIPVSTPVGTAISNTATVSAANGDVNAGNNSSTAPVVSGASIPALSTTMLGLLAVGLAIAAFVTMKQ